MPFAKSVSIVNVMFLSVTAANPASSPTIALNIKVKFFSETCLYLQIKKRLKSVFLGMIGYLIQSNKKYCEKQDFNFKRI